MTSVLCVYGAERIFSSLGASVYIRTEIFFLFIFYQDFYHSIMGNELHVQIILLSVKAASI